MTTLARISDWFVFKMTISTGNQFPTLRKIVNMIKRSMASLFAAPALAAGILLTMMTLQSSAEELHVNAKTGNDANPGTKAQPLRTIREAATRINFSAGPGGDTIVLSEGVHLLTETVLLNNSRYTQDSRLTIRAESLPDDADWNPQRMPIIVTVVPTRLTPGDGEEARGLEIETSHVTLQGLHFTGSPDYYYIDGRQSRRSYPIWRDGRNLDDLLVTQCMFVGSVDLMTVRVAVIARGNGLVLDHCVFYNCENPVVFWDGEGGGHRDGMRYCLVYQANYSGVWTTPGTAEDFEFHHNIIANCRAAWIGENTKAHYQVHDCIFTGNKLFTANGSNTAIGSGFLQLANVRTDGTIEIEKAQGKNNYLQLKEGSFGSDLKAGLFKK
jgi:hypothetical protein